MWGSFLACVIFLQSRSEPHLLRHHTLTAVLFQGDWGLGGCPLPTLPSCWCLSWCFRPAGESSLALCLRDLRCWWWGQPRGGWKMLEQQSGCFAQPQTTSPPPASQSEFHLTGRAHPLPSCALLPPSPPASCLSALPLPWGPCCWGHPGHEWRRGYAGLPRAALSTLMRGFLSSGRLVGGQPEKGRLLCTSQGAWSPGCSSFQESGVFRAHW